MKNLMDGLMDELNRNRELLTQYKTITGSGGFFGASFIERDFKAAEEAIKNMDTIEMIRVYKKLKDNE